MMVMMNKLNGMIDSMMNDQKSMMGNMKMENIMGNGVMENKE